MYTQVWNKYLPVIKILLKRSTNGEQLLKLNTSDFNKTPSRKGTHKFNMQFSRGRVEYVSNQSVVAKELSSILLDDKIIKELFTQNEYHIGMDSKFNLSIKLIPPVPVEAELA